MPFGIGSGASSLDMIVEEGVQEGRASRRNFPVQIHTCTRNHIPRASNTMSAIEKANSLLQSDPSQAEQIYKGVLTSNDSERHELPH